MEQLVRKQGRANIHFIKDQPYIVLTVPPGQPKTKLNPPKQTFGVFNTILAELVKKDKGRKIIFDGNLVYRYFGLDPSLVITELELVMSNKNKAFGPIEVQSTTQLGKLMKSQPQAQQLTKQLPIFLIHKG